MKLIVSLIFILYFILCQIYFSKRNLYGLFLNLFVGKIVDKISVNIHKYLKFFMMSRKPDIHIFPNQNKSKN